jgi:hypothetical protein
MYSRISASIRAAAPRSTVEVRFLRRFHSGQVVHLSVSVVPKMHGAKIAAPIRIAIAVFGDRLQNYSVRRVQNS